MSVAAILPRRAVRTTAVHQSPRPGTTLESDGSLTVSVEYLTAFGGGDPAEGRKQLRLLLMNHMERDRSSYSTGPARSPESIRIATPRDEDALMDLVRIDLLANAAHIAPLDEERILAHIQTGTRRRGGQVGVIDGPDGKPVAVSVLIPQQWWWSSGWFFQELVNFVHPAHRNSHHAEDLLDFTKWQSDRLSKLMGYRCWLLCGVLGAWRIQSKIALYRRKFMQAGAAFIYPAPPVRGN